MHKQFCSLSEGAAIYSISAIRLKQMAQKGEIPAVKLEGGKKWLIDMEAMTRQLRACLVKADELPVSGREVAA